MRAANFWIGNVPVSGDALLSPMAGFSDSPYRRLCRRFGSCLSYTEFVSAEMIRRGMRRSLDMFRFVEEERPLVFQIFGNQPEVLLYAAQTIEELGPDIIDINMGCSVTHVAHRGSGAGMLCNPEQTGRTMELLRRHLRVPLTAKIRLGWDDKHRNYLEMARVLEESGVAALAVHGRTKAQAYSGRADWDAIGEIAARLSIPVLGNGDVTGLREAREKQERYSVAAVLVGRAAIGNPWLFADPIGRGGERASPAEILDTLLLHWSWMREFYEHKPLILFRKHAARYLAHHPALARAKSHLLQINDAAEFEEICLDLRARPGNESYHAPPVLSAMPAG